MRTQPITIAQADGQNRFQDEHDEDGSSLESASTGRSNQNQDSSSATRHAYLLNASLSDLNRDMGGLKVGSLPSSRKMRRYLISTGANKSYGTSHLDLGNGGFSRSMPPPKAPFLSSRRESNEKLSSLPRMSLPGCAADVKDLSSVPFGSLRESRFHRPRTQLHNSNRVRFAGGCGNETSSPAGEGLRDCVLPYAEGGLFPQSLPAYSDSERCLIQRRWEKNADDQKKQCSSPKGTTNESKVSGLGLILSDIGQSVQQTGVDISSSHLLDGKPVKFDSGYSATPGTEGSFRGGIGSVLERELDHAANQSVFENNGFSETFSDTGPTLIDYNNYTSENNRQPNGSLTGLGILKLLRVSSGVQDFHLDAAERENEQFQSYKDDEATSMRPQQRSPYNLTKSLIGSTGSFDDRPPSPNNPDTFEAFDLDMDE